MKNKKVKKVGGPIQGGSFFVRSTEYFRCAHCHALYLGPDETGLNKVLLGTFTDGWAIVDLEGIEDATRFSGKFNIESEILNEDKECIGYEYVYYDNTYPGGSMERFIVKVKKDSGVWKIISEFRTPSWAE